MKKILLILPLVSIVASCNLQKKPDASAAVVNNTTAQAAPDPPPAGQAAMSADDAEAQKILGSYVGAFGDNKITLLITKVAGGAISGRSIVGGNDRPFDGTYSLDNASYVVSAREPGDNKYDGVFSFSVASAAPDKAAGAPPDQGQVVDMLAVENSRLDARLKTICRGC